MKILILCLFLTLSAHARLITKSESKSVLNNLQIKIYVKTDGSYSVDKTYHIEVIDAQRLSLSEFPVPFNPKTSKIKLLEGYVETKGVKTTLNPQETTTATLNPSSDFDPLSVWNIKIPAQENGSRLHVRYQMDVEKPFIAGFFAQTFNLLDESLFIEKLNILVVSELPLEFKVRDASGVIKVEHLKKKYQELKFTLMRPLVQGLKDEQQSHLSAQDAVAVSVATTSNWNTLKRTYKSFLDLQMNASIPAEMSAALKSAQSKYELKDQLKIIVDHLHSQFSLNGFMRTINGKPVFRMFKDLYLSKMADDKEMASFMSFMLKKLNYKADVVISNKGSPALFLALPDSSLFNRALVKVEVEGEFYWIDPTEKTSLELNHPAYFSGRPSLGLTDEDVLELIALKNPIESEVILSTKVTLNANQEAVVQSDIQYKGQAAYELSKVLGPKDLEEIYSQDLGVSEKSKDLKLVKREFWKVEGSYKEEGELRAHPLGDYFSSIQSVTPEWLGELQIDGPKRYKTTTVYAFEVDPTTRIACSIQSDWLEVQRRSVIQKSSFVIYDTVKFLQSSISPDELKSKAFLALQIQLKECSKKNLLVLKNLQVDKL